MEFCVVTEVYASQLKARGTGTCKRCGEPIMAKQHIARFHNGSTTSKIKHTKYYHAECYRGMLV